VKYKYHAHKTYKKTLSHRDYTIFAVLRSKCKEMQRSNHNEYLRTVEANIKINVKAFWNHINSKKIGHGLPGVMRCGDEWGRRQGRG
jgi:hypothetical protein